MEAQLLEQIKLLSPAQIEELRLFVEFLLTKPQLKATATQSPHVPLQGLQRIAVPVNEVILNRADIYEDRI